MVTPLGGQIVDQIPEAPPRFRLDAGGRLIEKQHRRAMQDGAAERQALLPAAGEGSHQRIFPARPARPSLPSIACAPRMSRRGTR